MWLTRMTGIGQYQPFDDLSEAQRDNMPPNYSTLYEITRVPEGERSLLHREPSDFPFR